jgi:hypothetical protein
VIIGDLNIVCIAVLPDKTDSPLVVDPDAVLTLPISRELLETVTRWRFEVLQRFRPIQNREFAKSRPLYNWRQPPGPLALENLLGLSVTEASDHFSLT